MVIGIDCSRAFVQERTGTENYSYFLLRELLSLSSDHSFRLYIRKLDPEKNDNDWLTDIEAQLPKTHNFELVLIPQKRLWTQFGLAMELRKRPVDVLFVPSHTLPLLRPKGIKTVVTIHDLGYEYLPQHHQFPHMLWLTYFTEYAVHEADRLIAVSEATKDDVVSKLDANADKISVVYEGYVPPQIDSTSIDTVTQRYGLNKPYIVFVGTVQPRKNLVRMIEAFSICKTEEHYKDYEFVIIGKKGWLSDEIYAAPELYGVKDSVKFLGYLPDVEAQAIWSRAVCTFYATLFEGFGIPILDSQALGVPVITSNKKPFTEVGGEACVFVNELNVIDMARDLGALLGDSARRQQLVKLGRENCTRFSWKKAAEETLRVIEKV